MNVAFDVDGVVLRSIEVILETINELEGRDLSPEDLTSWDLEPLGLRALTLMTAVDRMYAEPGIEPYEGAVSALGRIYQETRKPLLFITGRQDPRTAEKQLTALPWNPTVPDMIVIGGTRDKRSYLADRKVDFIVEDDPKHLADYLSSGHGVGLMVQPWNRQLTIPVHERFHSWKDVEAWFEQKALRRKRL